MPAPPTSSGTDWPITVVVRWKDHGFSQRDIRWWAYLLAGFVWITGGTLLLEGRLDFRLLLLLGLLGGRIAWQWARRRPGDFEMILEPEQVLIRDLAGGAPAIPLPRQRAGALLAFESGLDWRERLVLMTDDADQEVYRLRAAYRPVQVRDAAGATGSWWRSNMPADTSPLMPPTALSITALLGAWWPNPNRRSSVRGTSNIRRPWREGDLSTYAAWDRRQRRLYGLVLISLVVFVYGLAFVGSWPWTVTEAVEFLPPGLIGLALGARNVLG
jgi:hypothetical protein